MNKAFAESILRTALAVLTLVVGAQTPASAQSEEARENRIVGVWDIQVTVRNCSNGAALSNFRALHKYELGGTGQVVPATNPAALSSHLSVWKPVEKDSYQMAFKMFRFDVAGNNVGWIVVRNEVVINDDATLYAGVGRAETFDSNGNSLGAICPTFAGTRFK